MMGRAVVYDLGRAHDVKNIAVAGPLAEQRKQPEGLPVWRTAIATALTKSRAHLAAAKLADTLPMCERHRSLRKWRAVMTSC